MRIPTAFIPALLACTAVALLPAVTMPAAAQQVERYSVYCADDRIEVSFWDLAQMIVRRGNPVCLFASYTSRSDALTFAERNFGGEGQPCWCR